MERQLYKILMFTAVIALFLCMPVAAKAQTVTSGPFTFDISTGTIVNYSGGSEGIIDIPAKINDVAVTGIGDYAFYNFGEKNIVSVNIPDSVTKIGKGAFSSCPDLKEINVAASNQYFLSEEGILYNKDKTVLFRYPSKKTDKETYVIPDSVTSVEDYAFYSCVLTNVSVSKNIRKIPEGMFKYCSNLTSISLPDGLTSIGNWAFGGCASLADINIPNSVKEIGEFAFLDCDNLKSLVIPDSVTRIGKNAFMSCSNLRSIKLSTNLHSIDDGTFYNCNSLSNVDIPDNVTRIGTRAFYYCTALQSIVIPSNVINIDQMAFMDCSGLKQIMLPNSVTNIGELAFMDCSGLKQITIPNSMESCGYGAFSRCVSLKNVTILDGVKIIPDSIFTNCSNLSSIIIPDSVTEIRWSAFTSCDNLKYIYGTKGTAAETFAKNKGLSFRYASEQIIDEQFILDITTGAISNYIGTGSAVNIPSIINGIPVRSIEQEAFENSDIANLTISNGVIYIEDSAFSGCANLSSIVISNTVTSIGNSAFSNCISLTSVIIPEGITDIGNLAFAGCKNLKSITLPTSITSMVNYVFLLSSQLTIYGAADSFAQNYAFENNIPFVVLANSKLTGTIENDTGYTNAPHDGYKVEVIGQPVSTFTDVYGSFTLNIPNAITTFDIRISKPCFLSREIKNLSADKDLQLSPITLWAGDTNGDTCINMADIMEIAKAFNSTPGDALYMEDIDFNGDGAINIQDIMIAARHFNATGY